MVVVKYERPLTNMQNAESASFMDVFSVKQKPERLLFRSLLAESGEFLIKLVSLICFILNAKTAST